MVDFLPAKGNGSATHIHELALTMAASVHHYHLIYQQGERSGVVAVPHAMTVAWRPAWSRTPVA